MRLQQEIEERNRMFTGIIQRKNHAASIIQRVYRKFARKKKVKT